MAVLKNEYKCVRCTNFYTYSLVYCCYLTHVKNINKSLVNIFNVFIIRIFILLNRKKILNSLYLNTALRLELLDNMYTIYIPPYHIIFFLIYSFIFQTWQHYYSSIETNKLFTLKSLFLLYMLFCFYDALIINMSISYCILAIMNKYE